MKSRIPWRKSAGSAGLVLTIGAILILLGLGIRHMGRLWMLRDDTIDWGTPSPGDVAEVKSPPAGQVLLLVLSCHLRWHPGFDVTTHSWSRTTSGLEIKGPVPAEDDIGLRLPEIRRTDKGPSAEGVERLHQLPIEVPGASLLGIRSDGSIRVVGKAGIETVLPVGKSLFLTRSHSVSNFGHQ